MAEGYTKIKNDVLKGLARLKVSGATFNVLFAIITNTLAFHKDQHQLSIGFLEKATGLSRMSVVRAIQELCDLEIIKITGEKSGSRPRTIRIYSTKIGMIPNPVQGSTNSDTKNSTNSDTQEIKEKEILNKREKKKTSFSSIEEMNKYYDEHPEEVDDDDDL